jgi:SAM-dependent methyltransferase
MRIELGSPIEYGFYGVTKRIELVKKYITLQRGDTVLDLGCGKGAYSLELSKDVDFVVSCDIERERLRAFNSEIKKRGAKINPFLCDGVLLPFRDNSFDYIFLIEVIEHVRSEEDLLGEIKRVLKRSGLLIVFAPNKLYPMDTHIAKIYGHSLGNRIPFSSWLPDSIHDRVITARIYTVKKLRRVFVKGGWDVVDTDYMLPPLDKIKIEYIRMFLRGILRVLETTPLKKFGVSILMICKIR